MHCKAVCHCYTPKEWRPFIPISAVLRDQKTLLTFQMFCSFCSVTPEGFTTMVASEGLDKARAYINQVPLDRWLNVPSKGHEGNLLLNFTFWVMAECILKRQNPCCQWGQNLGPLGLKSSASTTWPPSNHVCECFSLHQDKLI